MVIWLYFIYINLGVYRYWSVATYLIWCMQC